MGHEKVFVAIHGIGDQTCYETIQVVARQVFKIFNFSGALPLGQFYSEMEIKPQTGSSDGRLLYKKICQQGSTGSCNGCKHPHDPQFGCVSFAEVYWAGIPRKVADEGHTLEETKSWVKTIVERLRAKSIHLKQKELLSRSQFRTVKQVLLEMVMAVGVIERLVGWLEKHTTFRFPLKKVLDQYVADVQVVAEYRPFREEILAEFCQVMGTIRKKNPAARIYLIAHSEGTVVALLGLLRGLCRRDAEYSWVENVHGLMTLGSPIDKHLILWPELWSEFESDPPSGPKWRTLPAVKTEKDENGSDGRLIPWFNYYDYGDPVGFDLDAIRSWMKIKGGNPPLDFDQKKDIGFSRYIFPGMAHVEYWRDRRVFGHFMEQVVLKEELERSGRRLAGPPGSKPLVGILSFGLSYLLVTVACGIGVFILYKATVSAPDQGLVIAPLKLLELTLAVACVTGAARIPGLARGGGTYAVAILLGGAGIGLAYLAGADLTGIGSVCLPITAAAIGLFGWISARLDCNIGMFGMLATGAAGICVLISSMLLGTSAAVWPVVVAGIGFIYFWWIAALLFDLSFVWHRYIRCNVGMHRMQWLGGGQPRRDHLKAKRERILGEPKIEPVTWS